MTPVECFEKIGSGWDCGDCRQHPSPFQKDEVAEVIHFAGKCCCMSYSPDYKTCGSYCDSESFAVFKLKDGRFATFWEGSDSSGHGCQCSQNGGEVFATLEDAIRLGIDENARQYLNGANRKES